MTTDVTAAAALDEPPHAPLLTNARDLRALQRLYAGPTLREEMDRVVGTSNSPEYVSRLRKKLAVPITCDLVERVDRDGKACFVGRYSISEQDRAKVAAIIALSTAAASARQSPTNK